MSPQAPIAFAYRLICVVCADSRTGSIKRRLVAAPYVHCTLLQMSARNPRLVQGIPETVAVSSAAIHAIPR
jgi:hypothetical protein